MRLTKRQLKRIIREEYSRLKRRGLIKESKIIDREQKNRIQVYCDEVLGMDVGLCEVISCDDGLLSIPLVGFEDVRAMDIQDMRTQIEAISGDIAGECEDALAEYYATFDTLICVRAGQLMACPADAWQLLPLGAMGEYPDGAMRPSCQFELNVGMCETIGSFEDAMGYITPMDESRRRRRTTRRNRRY